MRPRALRSPGWKRVRWDTGAKQTCLLTTLHPERALSRALEQHLSHEMPDIDFILHEREGVDTVWVCGYKPGCADLVAELRIRHPDATLVVTGREPTDRWESDVRAAGADVVCSWPVPYSELSRVLHFRRGHSPE
jgi:hypothetical protein